MVGCARADGARCTSSIRCGSPISATARRSISTAMPSGSIASPACASSISAAAAAFSPSRWRGSARRWSAPIRRQATSRWRSITRRRPGLRSTIAARRRRRWRKRGESFDVVLAMEVVEHVADVGLFVDLAGRHGETRRPAVRRHAQSHHEKLCARHRRRRIHFALAAARHPSMGQVRHAQRARNRHRAEPGCRSPTRPA